MKIVAVTSKSRFRIPPTRRKSEKRYPPGE